MQQSGLIYRLSAVSFRCSDRRWLLTVYNDGQYRRYFESNAYVETDVKLILLLRHDTARKILTALSQSGPILHKDLTHRLGLSSQALTWQMNQLKRKGLIEAVKEEMSVKYFLNEKAQLRLGSFSTLLNFQE